MHALESKLAEVQPFSHNSRAPTVPKECQIGLYDPSEADLELFWNNPSAGFLGERLYAAQLLEISTASFMEWSTLTRWLMPTTTTPLRSSAAACSTRLATNEALEAAALAVL